MSIYESVRAGLLNLGPRHPLLRAAIRMQARLLGFRVSVDRGRVKLRKARECAIFSAVNYPSIPAVCHMWDHIFSSMVTTQTDGMLVLDFSQPALHTYRRSGVSFYFPGVVEEDASDYYTREYKPAPGDVVWDVGANAGATTYFFSKMVGEQGTVFAFEPDGQNFEYLLRNIEMHRLSNVVPLQIAMASRTGRQTFSMTGTVGSGLVGRTQCADSELSREVETISFADACTRFGGPAFVKMDIEGAELEVISGALELLRRERIHLAIETEHRVDGKFTSGPINSMLAGIGYRISTGSPTGEQFTWATPPASGEPLS